MRTSRTDGRPTSSLYGAATTKAAKGQRTTELGRPIPTDSFSRTRAVLASTALVIGLAGVGLAGAIATGVVKVTYSEATIEGTINCSSTIAQTEAAIQSLKNQLAEHGMADRATEAAIKVRDEIKKRCG